MADFTANFEAGVNGATITTGAGEASATAWSSVNNTPKYDNTHVHRGALAGKFSSEERGVWNLTSTEFYGRSYIYLPAAAAGGTGHIVFQDGGNPRSIIAFNYVGSNTIWSMTDNDFSYISGAVPYAHDQWIRIEYHFIVHPTNGLLEVKLFNNADSTIPDEVIAPTANRNTGSALTHVVYGEDVFGGFGASFWLDDIVANATSYPGPVPQPQTNAPTLVQSRSAVRRI